MIVELNIGMLIEATGETLDLDNTKMWVNQILNEDYDFELVDGEWNGKPQQTLYVIGDTTLHLLKFIECVQDLCAHLAQDSIAVVVSGRSELGMLIYRADYEGKKYRFSNEFFIRPKTEYVHKVGVNVTVRTKEADLDAVVNAIAKGIYWGLDHEPYSIASPMNVTIKFESK